MYVLFITSLTNIAYLILVKPFDTPLLNYLEIFNELCLYLMCYPCLIFTDLTLSEAAGSSPTHFKYNLGWLIVAGVITNIVVNMLIMLGLNIRMAYRALSRKPLKERCSWVSQWCNKCLARKTSCSPCEKIESGTHPIKQKEEVIED